jgi:hypothetical protein
VADSRKAVLWAVGGSLVAVLAAWALTDPGGQARLSEHFSVALGSGQGEPLPGQAAPIKTGHSQAPWTPHVPKGAGTRLATRHPRTCSPNMTALQAQRYDWMFCPPSEDDL